ncbi:unnamed protein product [Phaedon cochleariae]|uniref:Helitron helicase-like domain-containing protein n=1 Tax=Phaedon cochleariae TaxID=80249 RepID=A0A9N9SPW1_PHACE|nr:unnamed protein product [Phaedon cochleariae]
MVARHAKPDLFITFTCNPSWPEIEGILRGHQKWIWYVAYHTELIDELTTKQPFEVPLNYIYTVEFQKRGLPHAHFLVILRPEDRLDTVQQIDNAVCAQLLDRVHEPKAYGYVV